MAVCLRLLNKTATDARKMTRSVIEIKPKYTQPMLKQKLKRTAKMHELKTVEIIPFPFAYQQITAKTGDSTVIAYQIIMYPDGSKPLKRTV